MDKIIIISDDDDDDLIKNRQCEQTQSGDVLQFAFKHLYRDESTNIESPNKETPQSKQRLYSNIKSGVDVSTALEISPKEIPLKTRPRLNFTTDSSQEPPENELKSDVKTTFKTPCKGKSKVRKPTNLFPQTSRSGSRDSKSLLKQALQGGKSSAEKLPINSINNRTTKEDEDCMAEKTISVENIISQYSDISIHPIERKLDKITIPKPKFDEESCPILDRLFFSDEPKKKHSSIIINTAPENSQINTPKGLPKITNHPEASKTNYLLNQPQLARTFNLTAIENEPVFTSTPLAEPQKMDQCFEMLEGCSKIFEEIDSSLFNLSSSRLNEPANYTVTTKTIQNPDAEYNIWNNDYTAFSNQIFDKIYPTKIENILNAKKLRSGVLQYNDINFNTVKVVGYVRSLEFKEGIRTFLLYDDTGRVEIRYRPNQERLALKDTAEQFVCNKDILKQFNEQWDSKRSLLRTRTTKDILEMGATLLGKKNCLRNRQFPRPAEINWGMRLIVIGRVSKYQWHDKPISTVIFPWCIKLQNENETVLHQRKMTHQKIKRDAMTFLKTFEHRKDF